MMNAHKTRTCELVFCSHLFFHLKNTLLITHISKNQQQITWISLMHLFTMQITAINIRSSWSKHPLPVTQQSLQQNIAPAAQGVIEDRQKKHWQQNPWMSIWLNVQRTSWNKTNLARPQLQVAKRKCRRRPQHTLRDCLCTSEELSQNKTDIFYILEALLEFKWFMSLKKGKAWCEWRQLLPLNSRKHTSLVC